MEHSSIIGGSSAKRRANCTGSAALEAQMPAPKSTEWSLQGDALHAMMYDALDEGTLPERGKAHTWRSEDVEVEFTAKDLEERFWPVYDAMCKLIRDEDLDYDLELRYAHPITADQTVFGTLDFIGRSQQDGRVWVVDYKFGQGIKEFARESYQLAFYLTGCVENGDPLVQGMRNISFVIAQPWRDSEEVFDIWETDISWLESYRTVERRTFVAISTGQTALNSGDHCRFCRAAAICPEQRVALDSLGQMEPPKELPAGMTVMKLAELLELGERAVSTQKKLMELATQLADSDGIRIPGWKVIDSVGNRTYTDAAEAGAAAVKVLGSEAFKPQELRSPAQLEKAFKTAGKDFDVMSKHIYRPNRGVKLVRDTHSAPARGSATTLELPAALPSFKTAKKKERTKNV